MGRSRLETLLLGGAFSPKGITDRERTINTNPDDGATKLPSIFEDCPGSTPRRKAVIINLFLASPRYVASRGSKESQQRQREANGRVRPRSQLRESEGGRE